MKYKWLLFDADDTLFDYNKAEFIALRKTFEENGLHCSDTCHERYREINFGLFKELERGEISSSELRTKRFELLFREFNIPLHFRDVSKRYLSNLADNSMLIPGAEEIVRELSLSCKMLIVTNGIADVQRPRLEKSVILKYFDDIIISDEIGAAKPASKFFDIAFKQMGYPDKKEVMIIGDSLTSDMSGGINYGIDTCWYNPNRMINENGLNITLEVNELETLKSIVELS
jgi:2-haloacid dehalogenase